MLRVCYIKESCVKGYCVKWCCVIECFVKSIMVCCDKRYSGKMYCVCVLCWVVLRRGCCVRLRVLIISCCVGGNVLGVVGLFRCWWWEEGQPLLLHNEPLKQV